MPRERGRPSDLTDAQRALIEPLLPTPNTGERPETHPRRDIVDADQGTTFNEMVE